METSLKKSLYKLALPNELSKSSTHRKTELPKPCPYKIKTIRVFSLHRELRSQQKTASKFLMDASFLCSHDAVTTTLLWNTIRGYTQYYLSQDDIWSKETDREE
jgi:hypothetical protein